MDARKFVEGVGGYAYIFRDDADQQELALWTCDDPEVCMTRRGYAPPSAVSWAEAQEIINGAATATGGAMPHSSAVLIKYRGIKETMDKVALYGFVSIHLPDAGHFSIVYAGPKKARVYVHDPLREVSNGVMNFRDLRSLLSEVAPAWPTDPWERQAPRANSIAEWLAEHAEQGVFEVDARDQEVPLHLREDLALADWRFCEGRKFLSARSLGPTDLAKMARNVDGKECSTLLVDITQNFGWTRGVFGDGDSCWWTTYNTSRSTLYHAGGFAIRLWNSDGYGVGRIWACPTQDGGVLLFNAYGRWMAAGAAALLEHATGIPLWPTEMRDGKETEYGMYINPTMAFVGDVQQASELSVPVRVPDNAPLAWRSNSASWEDDDWPPNNDHLSREPLCDRLGANREETKSAQEPEEFDEAAVWDASAYPIANLGRRHLAGMDLAGISLPRSNLHGAVLRDANLSDANLNGATLTDADMTGARLVNANLQSAFAPMVVMARACLDGADLASAYMPHAVLSSATASLSDFAHANLSNADLSALFSHSAVFHDGDLLHAVLTGATLFRADFRRATLTRSVLEMACLECADLSEALLGAAHLQGTNLRDANLTDANLAWADLTGACLVGANLTGADLTGANLAAADLTGADLTRAILVCCLYDQQTRWPEGAGFVPPSNS